ncbi:GntR family transcriptional regulator [uncultured Salinisphaera sp.]|uniref:GntR family transcriptional regulator n=1 Tax=uncultured Salinisphaera sp. TaxID=359372 RepID=UPI0032B24FAC|tara:strand:- start:376 stop:1056 length:681 start_codon:yes stop_codon:yes gene_type:complete
MSETQQLGQVARRTVEDEVYGRIRAAILTGEIEAGERLVHDDLAQRFGTSRIPVRDALKRLVLDGLVETEGGRRGYRVTVFGRDDIEEIYSLRVLLETRAVRFATAHIDADTLTALDGLQTAIEAAAAADERERYVALNQEFHTRLYAAAGQPRLARLIDGLWRGLPPLTPISVATSLTETAAEHRPILAAMANGDAEAAANVMADHIDRARVALSAHVDAEGRLI